MADGTENRKIDTRLKEGVIFSHSWLARVKRILLGHSDKGTMAIEIVPVE
ncbi:MAG: hypothetical protein QG614_620 [Patescibacteria group bacterium]|nr:hypothetical protein [Patescibacteria group bacterium]